MSNIQKAHFPKRNAIASFCSPSVPLLLPYHRYVLLFVKHEHTSAQNNRMHFVKGVRWAHSNFFFVSINILIASNCAHKMEKVKSLAVLTFFFYWCTAKMPIQKQKNAMKRRIMAIFFHPHFAMFLWSQKRKKFQREYAQKMTVRYFVSSVVNVAKRLKLMRPDHLHKVIIPVISSPGKKAKTFFTN